MGTLVFRLWVPLTGTAIEAVRSYEAAAALQHHLHSQMRGHRGGETRYGARRYYGMRRGGRQSRRSMPVYLQCIASSYPYNFEEEDDDDCGGDEDGDDDDGGWWWR